MQLLGYILLASVMLAALKVAFGVLLIGYLLTLFVSAIVKPAETFGILAFFALMSLLQAYPVICLALAAAIVVAGRVMRRED